MSQDLKENLQMLLASIAFAVGGTVALFYVEGWDLIPAICACLAGTAGTVGSVCCLHRDRKNGTLFPKILKPQERKQGTELAAELPFSLLAARFRQLAKYNDTVVADEDEGFLGWNETPDMHIYRTEGENWLALYWVSIDNYLRDSELSALLRRHKLPMADDYRKKKATGLAVYHDGKLTLYPAAFEPEFRHHFLTEFLCPEADYNEWFNRCYGEDEARGINQTLC